jgi:hypothetical protein
MPLFCYPKYWGIRAMTAIVRTLTPQGFALVADGRCSNSENYAVISDEVQKIFPVTCPVGVFALCFSGADGFTSLDSGEQLKLPQLAMRCATSLEGRKCANAVGYAHRLSRCINEGIKEFSLGGSIHSGTSAQPNLADEFGDTICRIALVGIENIPNGKKASAVDLRFYHVNGVLRDPEVKPETPLLIGGYIGYSPSQIVGHLVCNRPKEDERLSAYRRPMKEPDEVTLQDAIEGATAFILAHSDPEAIEIDDKCRAVGGHIHSATITPDEGFQWVTAPKRK